ncbi:MAG: uroporphyrinogen-III synthase [candidate division Zixibacteria bacterium]|nr:uroporphyrinogen-III synthase [candidate division Zixibacteria bacterium]MDH3937492.1 uroporphyrinogen-III synthase [candidate division Zixibacteria bacterium]MDH4035491.1 uroporphyrinogen-III synthase [candidate division Zixibacteria bacterium]
MRLGVTRAVEQLSVLSSRASIQGIEIVALPMTHHQPLPFEWPAGVSPNQVDWLFFTSANGVRGFFEQLDGSPFDSAQGEVGGAQGEVAGARPKIAAVGDKTTQALKGAGWTVSFQPTVANGEALFREFVGSHVDAKGMVFYARAKRVNFDPDELFAKTGFDYYPIICYETKTAEVNQQVVAMLEDKDYILFTAPSAVRAYDEKFGPPKAMLIAIGPTTASAMTNCGWTKFMTMKQPDVDRVLEYL